jgi:hypothetical protein
MKTLFYDVLQTEVHALKQGFILAQIVGSNSYMLFMLFSINVVQAMNEGDYFNEVLAAIVDDCYHLTSEFLKVKFKHNFRETNKLYSS